MRLIGDSTIICICFIYIKVAFRTARCIDNITKQCIECMKSRHNIVGSGKGSSGIDNTLQPRSRNLVQSHFW